MSRGKPKIRRTKPRITNIGAAVVALALVLFGCYMVFDGNLPFGSSTFTLKAVFTSNTDMHITSPVRIAGVDVGEVVHVDRLKGSTDAGILVMKINSNGLPIHADATAQIQSRTFLEGNFYVQLSPGTPGSPILGSGAVLPAANTSGPVQLDRVVSALNSNARSNLQKLVQGLGGALNGPSQPGDQAGQPASVKDLTGAQGLNYALKYSANALESSAIVNQALLGQRQHDLSGSIKGQAQVFSGLARSGASLGDFIDHFDQTMSALASRQGALSATIGALPALLRAANGADKSLSASFAPTQRFAKQLSGSIGELGPTIDTALPWLKQSTTLVSEPDLGGLLRRLRPAVADTSVAVSGLKLLSSQAGQLSECFSKVLVKDANEQITVDPSLAKQPLYRQLMQGFVGLASSSGALDGNGRATRASVGGGSDLVTTKHSVGVAGKMTGNAVLPPLGSFPDWPAGGKTPEINTQVPCDTQTAPDLNATARGGTP
jgi:phospholipid/cholesterol/gamma-HCH transport system substrate-binding protein